MNNIVNNKIAQTSGGQVHHNPICKLIHGDCLEIMKNIPDESIDMILCDMPFGTTKNKWDKILDLDLLWEQYERIIKKEVVLLYLLKLHLIRFLEQVI